MNSSTRGLLGFASGAVLAFASFAVFSRSQLPSPPAEPAAAASFSAPLLAGAVESVAQIARLEDEVRALEARLAAAPTADDSVAARARWRASALAWAREYGQAARPDDESGSRSGLYRELSELHLDLAFYEGVFSSEINGHPELNRLLEAFLEARGLPLDPDQSVAMTALLEKQGAEWQASLARRSNMTGLEIFAEAFHRAGESDAALRALMRPEQWASVSRIGGSEDKYPSATGLADDYYSYPSATFDSTAPDAAERLTLQWSKDLLLSGRSPEVLRPYVDEYLRLLGNAPSTRYPAAWRILSPAERGRHALAQAAVQRAMLNDAALTSDEHDRVRQWLQFYTPLPPPSTTGSDSEEEGTDSEEDE